jgi:hypothetical protein
MLACLILISGFNGLNLEKNKDDKQGDKGKALGYAKLAAACISSLSKSIPPNFCYKKGADFGVIPTGCPKGYFRSLALCFEYCKPGWTHILGICYEDCGKGFADHGLSCYKHIFDFYFKSSYIPSSLTNFSDKIPCPGDMYRSAALCYRDCRHIGLSNCGIGACASHTKECIKTVVKMAAKVLKGLYTAAVTIASFGTASAGTVAAKVAVKAGIKAMGKAAAKAAAKASMASLKKVLSGGFKKTIKNIALNQLKRSKTVLMGKIKAKAMGVICKNVWDTVIKKTETSKGPSDFTDKLIDTVDVLGVKGVVKSCSDTSDGGLKCAKGIINSLEAFDPTGLLTIVSAFLEPVCDVPINSPERDLEKEEEREKREEEEKKRKEKEILERKKRKELEAKVKEEKKRLKKLKLNCRFSDYNRKFELFGDCYDEETKSRKKNIFDMSQCLGFNFRAKRFMKGKFKNNKKLQMYLFHFLKFEKGKLECIEYTKKLERK